MNSTPNTPTHSPDKIPNGQAIEPGSLKGMSILYVDNCCPELGQLIKRVAMRQAGAKHVECILTDQDAVSICAAQTFDLMILDIWCLTDKMAEVIEALSERTGKRPELALIGGSLPREIVEKPPWNRALFTLLKPFELATFFESAAGFWGGGETKHRFTG